MKQLSLGAELLVTQHADLFRIAREAQARSVLLLAEHHERRAENPRKALLMPPTEAHDAAVVAVTFTAFAAEAFINAYGVEHLHATAAEQLERLSWEQKWRLFPVLAIGAELPAAAITGLRDLMTARNRFAHGKASWSEWGDALQGWAKIAAARDAAEAHIEALKTSVRALAALDPRVQTGWLDGDKDAARIR